MIRRLLLAVSLVSVVVGLMVVAASAEPKTVSAIFTVNSTDDIDDGTCDVAHCSLREAINAANGATGSSVISFSLSTPATITLSSQLPNIIGDVTLTGPGASQLIVSGSKAVRVFQVDAAAALTLDGLTVAYGNMSNGGGIYNSGALTLTNSVVFSNTSVNGGGIYNYFGTVVITGSTIADNSGPEAGGGVLNWGGSATIINSLISRNSGGGLVNLPGNGTLIVVNSTVVSNTSNSGGGISSFSGVVTLTDVTVAGNTDIFGGGGILNNSTVMTLTNSTVSGNQTKEYGGGIYIFKNPFSFARIDLNNVTISNNVSDSDADGSGDGGGIYNGNALVFFKNTIIAGNTDVTGEAPDCGGTLTSQDYNLIQNTTGCTITDTTTHNQTGVNPLLGPLQNNGGSTFTHALLPGSPAIDAGDNATCEPTDQRGITRPVDGNGDSVAVCDIGAYEFASALHNVYLPIVVRNP